MDQPWLLVCKYTGGVFASLYGLYATLTDFHEKKNGKRILSKKGMLGIMLLLVASTLSLSSDLMKDLNEFREKRDVQKKEEIARVEEQKARDAVGRQLDAQLKSSQQIAAKLGTALKSLETDTRTTSSILNETKRAVRPLREFWLSLGFKLAVNDPATAQLRATFDNELQPFLKQMITSGPAVFSNKDVFPIESPNGTVRSISFPSGSHLMPVEREDQIGSMLVSLRFYRRPVIVTPKSGFDVWRSATADLSLTLLLPPPGPIGHFLRDISYDLDQHRFMIDYSHIFSDPQFWESTGQLNTLADLKESLVIIEFLGSRDLTRFDLRMWDGEVFRLVLEKVKRVADKELAVLYYGQFSDVFTSVAAPSGLKSKSRPVHSTGGTTNPPPVPPQFQSQPPR